MRENKIALENEDFSISKLDAVIEVLLVVLLAFMPLVGGARKAWSEEVVIVLSSAIVLCFLLKLVFHRDQHIIWSWAYVPVGIFLFIVIFQLISLPTGLISIISPNTVKLKSELLGVLPNAGVILKSMTLSFYSNATKHDLRLILSVAAVFVVVLNIFRRSDQIKRLLMSIAVIGGIIAAVALAQDLFGNGKIYWFVFNPHAQANAGSFINHNHYGQFMNLSIGAAIAWLCVTVHERFFGRQLRPNDILDYLGSRSARNLWLLVTIMGLGAVTIFISLTRGGMISMLIAAIFTTLLLTSRKSLAGRGWIMAVMALVVFAGVLLMDFDTIYNRFATLRDISAYEDRWQILKDLVTSFEQFPILGTGLGTHSVVYPMYRNITNTTAVFTHAENEYAQVLEEVGMVGLALLVTFGIIISLCYLRSVRTTKLPIQSAVYGLGFGLLAILIHSLSDYGQHVPSNVFLSAIFCALLLVLAGQKRNKTITPKAIRPLQNSTVLRIVVLLCISIIWLWSLVGANNARIAEAYWKEALAIEKGLAGKGWQGTESEYADLISNADAATRYEPDNKTYQYGLNLYRWHSISKAKGSDAENTAVLEKSMPMVSDIVNGLNKAIVLCPTYGPSYSLAGQIEKFTFLNDTGAEKIRKGFQLAPCDPICCFVAGRLDILEGKPEDSIPKFKRAVTIKGGLFKDVVNIYVNHLSRPRLAISAAGDSIDRLRYVAGVLKDMQYNDLAEQCNQKAKELLEIKCAQPDVSAKNFASLAVAYRNQQDSNKAIEYYRHALELDYGQVYWRYELARLLTETDRIPEALYEARICMRLRPQFKAAERLVGELSVNSASFGGKTD